MQGVTVRRAHRHDLPRLIELISAGALGPSKEEPGDLGPYVEALSEIEATPGHDVLVAEVDGVVVGLCQLITFRHLQARGGRCAELESVHVAQAFRSQGIGGLLVEAAAQRASALGCYRLQLATNKARTEAHRFYRSHGFEASHEGMRRPL